VGKNSKHLQLRIEQGGLELKAIGWNLAERAAEKLTAGTVCSLAFYPSINEWNGRRDVQLEVRDFQVGEAGSSFEQNPSEPPAGA
jgi:single-stranded-DNA-specific exonuclease